MAQSAGYYTATRHPWPCLLFVFPLLAGYEAGVFFLGGANPESVRNGADHWLRIGLQAVGVKFWWVPPALLGLLFVGWAWRKRADRPGDLFGVLTGMALESVTFALGLWAVSRVLAPLLTRLGVDLAWADPWNEMGRAVLMTLGRLPCLRCEVGDPALRQFVTYLGAGIYEEALFRLVLLSVLVGVFRFLELPRLASVALAAIGSAVLFSTAHHIGPYGQPYSNYLFLFRLVAGLYFALLYQFRGFGIAVGAHAVYNVMVSVT
jgi:hypothetical protein